MHVLVVCGAGYIGSHMVKMLLEKGHSVVTFDSLECGFRDAVIGGDFVHGDLANFKILNEIFQKYTFDGVMHFASYIQVGESMSEPSKYYRNNVTNTQNLLDAMVKHNVNNFIFSSTAAIFGEPHYTPIDESHSMEPINTYGRTKLMVEQMLGDYDRAYGLKSICLRYFNAAGADPDAQIGERHEPETHLIPLVLQAASGRRESISVFGRDYPTNDGTCVRDYIHVMDLCQAHLLAIEQLIHGSNSSAYNLGIGNGFSVQEVIDAAIKVVGYDIKVVDEGRREGDPAVLVADSMCARKKLYWKPKYEDLDSIITHAWSWEKKYQGQVNN